MSKLSDQTDEVIDKLFQEPLLIVNPQLPGEIQRMDWHMFRKRARQVLLDYRTNAVTGVVLLATSIAMFFTSHRKDEGSGESAADALYFVTMAVAILEFSIYIIGHGFFPASKLQQSSASNSRIQSILSVLAPVRFRQKKVTVAGQLLQQKPFLNNVAMCTEAVLIIASIVGYALPGGHGATGFSRLRYIHGLRSLRLLSPLANVIPSVTFLVNTFRSSLSLLIPASSFLAFFFILFGVISVDQFMGALSHRCVLIEPRLQPLVNYTADPLSTICMGHGRAILDQCVDAIPLTYCDEGESTQSFTSPVVCYPPMVCRDRGAPGDGFTKFDTIFNAWLTMFHISSLSNWSVIMYAMWAGSPRVLVGGFCILLIVVVSFILLNFVVAIITTSYSQARASMKLVESLSAGRKKGASLLNYRLSEFIWWSFPPQIVHYLSFQGKTSEGMRPMPLYESIRFRIVRNTWIAVIVILHAINGSHMPQGYKDVLRQIELANMILFIFEFVISVLASGSLGKYLGNGWRKFDALMLLLTIVGYGMRLPLSVLRSFRIVRLFQRVAFVRKRHLVPNTLAAGRPGLVVTLFMVVCLYVATGVAIQLFSDRPEEEQPPEHFNTPFVAVTTMFRLVTMDGWEKAMYHGMANQHWLIGLVFFVPAYVLFGYMLSSLYTAVVIDAFEPNKEDKVAWQRQTHRSEDSDGSDADGEMDDKDAASRRAAEMVDRTDTGTNAASTPGSATTPGASAGGPRAGASNAAAQQQDEEIEVQRVHQAIKDKSFSIFGVDSKFRNLVIKLVVDTSDVDAPPGADPPPRTFGTVFQSAIMLFVIGSCVLVAMMPAREACSLREERAIERISVTTHVAWDIVFVVVFSLEMLLKMVAHGVAFPGDDRPWYIGPTYFREIWNLLDFFLLVVMIVAFFYPEARSLRLLRALRPLRVVRRIESMRVLVKGVLRSIPNIVVLFIFAIWVLAIFGIIGVALFEGKMYYCTATTIGGVTVRTREDCHGMYFGTTGVLTPAAWVRYTAHFDHLGSAIAYLVEVASLSQFDASLTQATSIAGDDKQPRPERSLHFALFFFVFVVISAYFILNVVVGIILATLDEQKGILFLTSDQRDWFTIRKEALKLRPIKRPPISRFARIQRLVHKKWFDILVNVAVFLNIITISSVHRDQHEVWTEVQYYANVVFLVVFCVEALLKILAYGLRYFKNPWNLIDFAVVLGSLFEFTYQIASGNSRDVTITSAGRAFRILRIFRSIKRVPSLRGLFVTLGYSLPAIASITGFLFMLLFMYANLGMDLFGHLRFQQHLNKDANFRSLELSFFTLFRMVTLDGWNKIMSDVRRYTTPFCSDRERGWWYVDYSDGVDGVIRDCGILDDCSSELSQLYFFTFYGVGAFIFLNVLIAILLDNFNYISTQARSVIRAHHLDGYQRQWLLVTRAQPSKDGKFTAAAKGAAGKDTKNYEDYIDPKLLSSFIIDLFNADNALVHCDRGVHIHPVLTAASRLNFKKLVYELEFLGREEKLPEGKHCTFTNILLTCARMQMGREALTYRQQVERAAFEKEQVLAIIGTSLKGHLAPSVARARARVEEARRIRERYGAPDDNPNSMSAAATSAGASLSDESGIASSSVFHSVGAAQSPNRRLRLEPPIAAAPVPQQPTALSPSLRRTNRQIIVPASGSGTTAGNQAMGQSFSESPQTNNSDSHSPTQSRTQSFRKIVSFSGLDPEITGWGGGGGAPLAAAPAAAALAAATAPPSLLRPGIGGVNMCAEFAVSIENEERTERALVEQAWREAALEAFCALQVAALVAKESGRRIAHQRSFFVSLEHGFRSVIAIIESVNRRQLETAQRVRVWRTDALMGSVSNTIRTPQRQHTAGLAAAVSGGGGSAAFLSPPARRTPSANPFSPTTVNPIHARFVVAHCAADLDCAQYHDVAHQRAMRHTCRNGLECALRTHPDHAALFEHVDIQEVVDLDVPSTTEPFY